MNHKLRLFLMLTAVSVFSRQLARAQNLSYVKQDVIKVSGQTTDALVNGLTVNGIQTTKQFVDGLGRPIQTVAIQASPNSGNDIIQVNAYNNLGQQTQSYLPYVDNNGNPSGSFRGNAITDQYNYYKNSGPSINQVAYEPTAAYSAQVIENSPLQRGLESGMVGTNFQPVSGQHYKTVNYRSNTASDNVVSCSFTGTNFTYFGPNTLSVVDGTDEDGVETLVFTDANGHTILKRQVANQTVAGVSIPFFDTYYVYDGAGELIFIIPPKATQLLITNSSYTLSTPVVKNLLFIYTYDSMGRVSSKTVPGSGAISIVYDPLNRPVLTQTANMVAGNRWNYTKYDIKGRIVSQGFYVDATNIGQTAMQNYVTNNYTAQWYESKSTASGTRYYTNLAFPTTGITPLAYLYYDDYNWNDDANGVQDYSYIGQGMNGEETQTTAATKGLPTMMLQTTQGTGLTSTWLMKVMFYDRNGHLIQTQSNNQLNYTYGTLTDKSTTVPDFMGKPLLTKVEKVTGTVAGTDNAVFTQYTYDSHNMRVLYIDQQYNSQSLIRVAAYQYNELGQMVTKQLSATTGSNFLQTINYRFNIRGQLTSINNSTLTVDGALNTDPNALFGMQIQYDVPDANLPYMQASYSGRISAVKWMTRNAPGTSPATTNERSYYYTYDQLGRYTGATYGESTGSGQFTLNPGGFNENAITYDENSNIVTLQRYSSTVGVSGNTPTGGTMVDNLTYTYDNTNNNLDHLYKVADATGNSSGFYTRSGVTAAYTYDMNGNLKTDPYKGLNITYDNLNKTDGITTTQAGMNGEYIKYTYTADGALVRKQVYTTSASTTPLVTDYVDGFTYTTQPGATVAGLTYFPMREGRVINTAAAGVTAVLVAEYIITDQQGNARYSFQNVNNTVLPIQETSYYPFGSPMASALATPTLPNKRLYNGGSEWQNDFTNFPDLDQTLYRNYDPEIGRFIAVDPVPESNESMTTYQYAGNNPVNENDPIGNIIYGNGVSAADNWSMSHQFGISPIFGGDPVDGSGLPGNPGALTGEEMIEDGIEMLFDKSYVNGALITSSGIEKYSDNPIIAQLSGNALVAELGNLINGLQTMKSGNAIPGGGLVAMFDDKGNYTEIITDQYADGAILGTGQAADDRGTLGAAYYDSQIAAAQAQLAVAQESILTKVWNSDVARAVISDDMNISIGGSIVGIIGMGGSFNVSILTRGKDAGIHFNRTLADKVGAELGAGIGFSRGRFVGNPQNGTYGDLLGSGAEAGGDIEVGVAGWASFNGEAGVRMFGETVSIGPQIGASGGLTTTTDGWW